MAFMTLELCTTLQVADCDCATKIIPKVCLVTIVVNCNRCGYNGLETVALTVSAAHVSSGALNSIVARAGE